MHACDTGQFLRDGLIGAVLGRHPAQGHCVGETDKTVAPQPQYGEELLYAVQQAQVRCAVAFAPRGAAKHHRYRQHLNIEIRVAAVQIQIIVEQFYRFFFGGVIAEYAWAIVDKHVAWQHGAIDFQRVKGIGQILRQTLGAQGE
ncbi:hypothetical protein D3C77_623830 [compost metagenome]